MKSMVSISICATLFFTQGVFAGAGHEHGPKHGGVLREVSSVTYELVAKADFAAPATLNTIDGLRVDWPDGFGLIRASNTTPVLVLRSAQGLSSRPGLSSNMPGRRARLRRSST